MKTCQHCNKEIQNDISTKKYCSSNCKQLAYLKRNGLVLAGVVNTSVKDEASKDVKTTTVASQVNENQAVKYEPFKQNEIVNENSTSVKHEAKYFTEEQLQAFEERILRQIDEKINTVFQKIEESILHLNQITERYNSSLNANTTVNDVKDEQMQSEQTQNVNDVKDTSKASAVKDVKYGTIPKIIKLPLMDVNDKNENVNDSEEVKAYKDYLKSTMMSLMKNLWKKTKNTISYQFTMPKIINQ